MPLVLLLRGVNVGGHRTFRPSVLARELRRYDVVNVGAAGTFVVRNPGSRAGFRAALLRKLPVDAQVVICDGADLLRLQRDDPFEGTPPAPEVTRFVSFLSGRGRPSSSLPIFIPAEGPWCVRLLSVRNRLAFGEYRRQMKTIGCLGQLDALLGVTVTTRSWRTVEAIVRVLKAPGPVAD